MFSKSRIDFVSRSVGEKAKWLANMYRNPYQDLIVQGINSRYNCTVSVKFTVRKFASG
jgi:hypothetical protein